MHWTPRPPAAPTATTPEAAASGSRDGAPRSLHEQRRDRRGRGPRGPIAPAAVPIARSRSERFNELVLDAVERLERQWRDELAAVQFAVEDVPPSVAPDPAEPVPLARLDETPQGHRIVVHRWPIEVRTRDPDELAALVHDVVVEEVADLLGMEPEDVDPDYDPGPT